MFDFIYVLLGTIMRFIYNFVNNFGIAIILFTILVRVCLLPLVIKQQKFMAHMQKMQPKLQEIQKKYQYDKDKLNEETMKLYQQYKINPMSSCLPLFIQMPILIAIYGVIQNPITYILGHPVTEELKAALTVLCQTPTDTQLNVVAFVSNNFDKAKELLASIQTTFTADNFVMNFNFFGLNLGHTPSAVVSTNPIYWVLPVVAALTTFLTSYRRTSFSNEEYAAYFPLYDGIFLLYSAICNGSLLDCRELNPNTPESYLRPLHCEKRSG